MKLLCFGGTFNPIHIGHLICARAAAETLGYSRIKLIPSAQPPHKPHARDIAPALDRLAMCRLAIRNDPLFEVDDLEIRRSGPSFTLDTVRQLRQTGHDPVHWLIGADMLNYLPYWHEIDRLLREAHFVVMARPGQRLNWGKLPGRFQSLRQQVVKVPQIDISATAIRRRIAQGRTITYLVPQAVKQYIDEKSLYEETWSE